MTPGSWRGLLHDGPTRHAPGLALDTLAAEADSREAEVPYAAGPHLFCCIRNILNLTFNSTGFLCNSINRRLLPTASRVLLVFLLSTLISQIVSQTLTMPCI